MDKKQKMILELKKDIDYLERTLESIDRTNKKNKKIKKLKTFLIIFKLSLPYILSTGLVFTGFSHLGITPFKRDKVKVYSNDKKEYDSLGNVTSEKQYANYSNAMNTLILYDKWNINENGMYERNVKKYSLAKLENDKIEELLEFNENLNLENFLGKPFLESVETKNKVDNEELGKIFTKIILYSEDKNDFIVVDESIFDNLSSSAICLLVVLVFYYFIQLYQFDGPNKDKLAKSLEQIRDGYKDLDVDTLVNKLQIKRDNYNRLTR